MIQRVFPLLLAMGYWVSLYALRGLRSDHFVLLVPFLVLYYGGPVLRRVSHFVLPFLLTGIVYDSQRFYSNYLRGPVHVEEPYLFDKVFFGITTPEGVFTPNEWWQHHIHPVLDLISGFAYLVFFAVFIFIAAYFNFGIRKNDAPAAQKAVKKGSRPRI